MIYGKNNIQFKTENCTLEFTLFYQEAVESSHSVRVLYVICSDDEGEFQSPDLSNNNCSSALKRISFNVKLLQTFISEILYKKFGVHKTFNFFKNNCDEVCEYYKCGLNLRQALNMKSKDLFLFLANEIVSRNDVFDRNCKYLAILSFTRFEPPRTDDNSNDIFENTKGFCALGAEWLAVYGSASLYTWPESLEDLIRCCKDETLVDEKRFINDTAFRNTYWAAYSTSIGSLLHEFSHVLDLGHNQTGIMARGFDDFFAFPTINFKYCFCYEKFKVDLVSFFNFKTSLKCLKFKKVSTNNKMIERIMIKENDIKNGGNLIRRETVCAMFKNKTFEVISNLEWNKSSKKII